MTRLEEFGRRHPWIRYPLVVVGFLWVGAILLAIWLLVYNTVVSILQAIF